MTTRERTGPVRSRWGALRGELAVPLYRNAYALMLNSAVNSVLGLLYWVVAARAAAPEEVGRANALVSLMLMVSVLTQLNAGQALIRFLPRSGASAGRLVLGAYGLAVPLAALGAAAVVLWCHFAVEPGAPLHMSAELGAWFVVSTAAWSVFNLQDAALTGLRAATWVPLENGLYGLAKLGLLVALAAALGGTGEAVFTSWTLPVLVLLVPVSVLLVRRVLPRHAAEAADVELPDGRTLARYMGGDYLGQVCGQLSTSFLPVLVVALLGPAQGAFVLPAQTAFLALALLSTAITSSLVVEASRDAARTQDYARAVLRRIAFTVWPAALVVAVAAPWLLELFGPAYRENATALLQLLMLSTLPRIVVSLFVVRSRLENRTGRLAAVQLAEAALLLGGTAVLAGPLGLTAVGWAALAAQLVPALVLAGPVLRWLRRPAAAGADAG
jgi:O-antigen/teichoic acid export membrane protein